jgi:acyl-homoserine lactone acylase PvdQ
MYSSLATSVPITEAQIPQFYKDATFGVPAGDVASTESPEPGVTIERDSQFGVPHIYGDTRAALMFGIGYATAEDRLFFIDVLRHSGQGDLAQFAGGANVAMDEDVWANEPYTQQDLANQVNWAAANSPDGPQILSDATNYVDGINAYIAKAENPLNALTMLPAEYAAIGQPPGSAAVHGRRPRLDRDARRRNLRQRRRSAALERGPIREHEAEVRTRALRRGGLARAELAAR